jgi:hypothetical protein
LWLLSKWFYDIFTEAATGAIRCGSFMGMILTSWLLALGERGGHDDLRGSDRLSVIPYVHGRTELYCTQTWIAGAFPFLEPLEVASTRTFYSSRSDSLQ